jgi:hypothetical protein
MAGLAWITVPVGLGLIALAMLDVFLTVLHIQVERPISNPGTSATVADPTHGQS